MQICDLPDIVGSYVDSKGEEKQAVFSDGVGIITSEGMRRAMEGNPVFQKRLRRHGATLPAAIQVRIGGAKGMLTRWDGRCASLVACVRLALLATSPRAARAPVLCAVPLRYLSSGACSGEMKAGALVGLRPSMIKFKSDVTKLEVCDASRSLPFHLNRQIILALLTLGIDDDVFIGIFEDIVGNLEHLVHGGDAALEVCPRVWRVPTLSSLFVSRTSSATWGT